MKKSCLYHKCKERPCANLGFFNYFSPNHPRFKVARENLSPETGRQWAIACNESDDDVDKGLWRNQEYTIFFGKLSLPSEW